MANVLEIVIKGRDVSGSSTLRNMRGEMDKTKAATGGLKGAFSGLAGVLSGALKVGLAGGVAGVIALTGVMGGGVSKAMDLQQTVANTAAVMGKSTEEIQPLKTLIQDLAVDPLLKVSAEEAGTAINMLARNGLSMDEVLQGAAKSTVLLANATDAEFGTAADIATDTMALFNIEAKEMDKAVNGITSVVNNSKFSIDDYALALAQGGGVAATVGMQFDDFNTSVAAISPLFASGSDAGTSLKVMLQRLVPMTNAAADEMVRLGLAGYNFDFLSAEAKKAGVNIEGMSRTEALESLREAIGLTQSQFGDFKVQTGILQTGFHNLDGSIKSTAEISGALEQALSGLSDKQKTAALNTIFGTDAMRAAAGMAEIGREGFEQLQAQMGNTNAADAAATRMNTLAGQMDILRGIVEALQLKIGDAFIPLLQRLATQASAFLDAHGDRLVSVFELMAEKLGGLIAQIPGFVDQVTAVYNQVKAIVDPITSVAGKFLDWKTVLMAVGAAIAVTVTPAIASLVAAAAPVVALFAGLVAASAALRAAWNNDFLGIKTSITSLTSPLAVYSESAKSGFSGIANSLMHNVGVFKIMKDWIDENMPLIQGTIDTITGAMTSFWENHGTSISTIVETTFGFIKLLIENTLANVLDTVTLIMAAITGDWELFGETLGDMTRRNWETITNLVQSAFVVLVEVLTTGREILVDLFATIGTGMVNALTGISWKGIGGNIIQGIKDGINFDGFTDWFKGKLDGLTALFPFSPPKDSSSPLTKLPKAGQGIITQLQAGIDSMNLDITSPTADLFSFSPPLALAPESAGGAGQQESRPITFTITQEFHGQVDSAAVESAARNGLLDAVRSAGL